MICFDGGQYAYFFGFDGVRKQALAAEINTVAGTGGQPAFKPLMPRSLRGGKVEGVGNGAAKRPQGEECEAARCDGNSGCSQAAARGGGGRRKTGAPETEDDATAPKSDGGELPRNTTESGASADSDTLRNGQRAGSTPKSDRGTPHDGGAVASHKEAKGAATIDTSAAVADTAAAAAAGVVADAADGKVLSGCTVSFRREDFIAEAHGDRGYDVVCLFSVVKWMHINGGDEAVREVFRKTYDLLSPGGRLVLEPQVPSTARAHERYLL